VHGSSRDALLLLLQPLPLLLLPPLPLLLV
jgi:hypothetical protein